MISTRIHLPIGFTILKQRPLYKLKKKQGNYVKKFVKQNNSNAISVNKNVNNYCCPV